MSVAQTVAVTVAGKHREFHLKPFTIAEALDHIEASETAWNTARASIKDTMDDPMQMTLSSRAYLEAVRPTVLALLSDPADDGGTLSDEEFWLLDAADPTNVIAAQEEFAQVRFMAVGGQVLVQECQREVISDALKASQALLDQLEGQEE